MSQTEHAKHIKTVFCDIDGCIFEHHCAGISAISIHQRPLPGIQQAFDTWCDNGYTIILTTGRPESLRDITDQQIRNSGLYYHHLIMGLPRGQRVIINDMKPNSTTETAACVNIERNEGLKNVNI